MTTRRSICFHFLARKILRVCWKRKMPVRVCIAIFIFGFFLDSIVEHFLKVNLVFRNEDGIPIAFEAHKLLEYFFKHFFKLLHAATGPDPTNYPPQLVQNPSKNLSAER